MAKIYIEDIKLTAVRNKIFTGLSDAKQVNIFDAINLSSGDYLPTQKMIEGKYQVYGGGGTTAKSHNAFNIELETLGIGRVGARCGCVFKIKPQSWITDNALYASKIDKAFDLEFLIHFLNFKNLNQYANTAAQPVISLKRISGIAIPKIDLKIQKEIVSILNNVENGLIEIDNDKYGIGETLNFISSMESLDNEISLQQNLLTQLYKSLLKEVIQGKLVQQEGKDGNATDLLKKIKAEKIKAGKKEKVLPTIKVEEIPFDIPKNWMWCRLGEMSINCDGARVPISQLDRERRKKIYDYYGASGVIDKIDGFTHEGKFLLIGEDGANLIAKSTPIAFITKGKFWVNNHAHVLNFMDDITLRFMGHCLNAIDIKPFISGGFQPKLSQGNLNMIPIPLPPLEEQKRIVKKLEEVMNLCEELKTTITDNQNFTDQLLQVTLKDALQMKEEVAQA